MILINSKEMYKNQKIKGRKANWTWYNFHPGDDRLRRKRLVPDCEPRGTDLEKSVHPISANRTNNYAALPLAA